MVGPGTSPGVVARGSLNITAPPFPLVAAGDDLARLIADAFRGISTPLHDGDVIVVAQKVVSKSEGRFVDLATVNPSERARAIAAETLKDPRMVELVLRESVRIVRKGAGGF